MPEPGNRSNFKNRWRRGFDPDQDYHDQHDHDWDNRAHRNAQIATVCIALARMNVRHLSHGEKCEQNQAHHGNRLQYTAF